MFDPFRIIKYDMNIMSSPLHECACHKLKCGRLWKCKKFGEWEMNNHQCSTKSRLIIQLIKFISMTWPWTYHLMVFSRPKMLVLSLWNPFMNTSTLCSTQQKCFESHMMFGSSSQNACELEKLMIMATHNWLALLTMWRSRSPCCTICDMHLKSKLEFTMRPLGHGTNWYACCNILGGVMLVHNHHDLCARDPIDETSAKIGLPNQT